MNSGYFVNAFYVDVSMNLEFHGINLASHSWPSVMALEHFYAITMTTAEVNQNFKIAEHYN